MIRGLSQYRLLRRLGAGGQAEVYLAFDSRLKRRVCIKLYHLAGSFAARRRAVAEARHLMRVESPQTVDVYDVVSAGSRLALVVQYVPGCTLEELLARSEQISPENALALLTDLAAALAALRRVAVVHGDIKPANILVAVNGRAVLSDFGAGALVGEQWSLSSPEALSPEQSRGDAVALSSDFFSLGLVLYRMLFGVHPFLKGNELDLRELRAGLREVPEISGLDLPQREAVESLLRYLLSPTPEDRPPGTFELRERLRDLRGLLPAANVSELPVPSASQLVSGGFDASSLPRKLVNVPLRQKAQAWLTDYWFRGSLGARGVLVGSILLPCIVLILLGLMPGPCVAIAMPRINVPHDDSVLAMDEQELRVLITQSLKSQTKEAVVLGAGFASDNRYTFSTAGTRDVCIAQRTLELQIDCDSVRCLLQLRAYRGAGGQERQMSLPLAAAVHELQQAVRQLLGEQQAFLMD